MSFQADSPSPDKISSNNSENASPEKYNHKNFHNIVKTESSDGEDSDVEKSFEIEKSDDQEFQELDHLDVSEQLNLEIDKIVSHNRNSQLSENNIIETSFNLLNSTENM